MGDCILKYVSCWVIDANKQSKNENHYIMAAYHHEPSQRESIVKMCNYSKLPPVQTTSELLNSVKDISLVFYTLLDDSES